MTWSRQLSTRARRSLSWRFLAGTGVLLVSASACVSSSEIQSLETRLADVQQLLLQVQKQGASKDEIRELEGKLEETQNQLSRGQAEAAQELQRVGDRVEELQASLEETSFRLTQLAQQIAATNQELESLRFVRNAPPGRTAPPPPPSPRGSNSGADPQALYETAYNDYLRGSLDLAALGFLRYLEGFADGELADNATYWLGESYYSQRKFQQAIEQFDAVLDRFPESDRRTSALLKKSYAYLELGQRDRGSELLRQVACEHAGTDEARIADQRLKDLGIDVDC